MSFQLNLELKQQTPMIHFQYGEKGAIFRATEVKPKLDRFIISKFGGKEKINKGWFIKETDALNYKLRINAVGTPRVSKSHDYMCEALDCHPGSNEEKDLKRKSRSQINGMYFANIVSENKDLEKWKQDIIKTYKETVFYDDPIKVTVLCFIPELLEDVSKYIEEFFAVHNFGSRQSKGFGSFVVTKINENDCSYTTSDILKHLSGYKYLYTECNTSDSTALLNHAMTVYAILKGGLNMTGWNNKNGRYNNPDNYIKSYIQRPFLDELYGKKDDGTGKRGSEKALIKKHKPIDVTDKRRENDAADKNYDGYVFIRAMLGLADHYEFRNLRSGNVNVYSLDENDFDIKRFKSPITIKIIGKTIFFIFDVKSLEMLVNKTFYLLDRPPVWFRTASYSDKKNHIMNRGWKIHPPEKFGEEEVEKLIEGFVNYFMEKRGKLSSFPLPYKNSASLTLLKGGK